MKAAISKTEERSWKIEFGIKINKLGVPEEIKVEEILEGTISKALRRATAIVKSDPEIGERFAEDLKDGEASYELRWISPDWAKGRSSWRDLYHTDATEYPKSMSHYFVRVSVAE